MDLKVDCKPFKAKLTEEGCLKNRQRAVTAALRLYNSEPGDVLIVNETDLDRLAGCSQCKECCIDGLEDVFVNAVTRDVTIIVDQVLYWDETWYQDDPEIQRIGRKRAYDKWNQKPEVKAAKRAYEKSGKRPERSINLDINP